jgi:hypothetical protein
LMNMSLLILDFYIVTSSLAKATVKFRSWFLSFTAA